MDFGSSFDEAFGSNQEAERLGIWVEFHNIRVKIARAGGSNAAFEALVERKTRSYRRAGVSLDSLPPNVQKAISREAYAEAIVLDWEGPSTKDGQPIKYTPEAGKEAFERYPDFFTFVVSMATDASNFRAAALENEAKN